MNNFLEDFLLNSMIEFKQNVNLSKYSYFKTGKMAQFIVYPNCIKELKTFYNFLINNPIPYRIIGSTTNLLFLDDIIYYVLISLGKFNKIEINEPKKFAEVESGVMLPKFVRKLAERGITGFEGLEGIPGTIGGAIYMNAGAYGYEISDNLINVNVLTKNGEIKSFLKKNLNFSFRYSSFKERDVGIILNARFDIENGNKDEIFKKIKYFNVNRRTYQEHKYPNLGSIFATKDIYADIAQHYLFYKKILYFTRKLNIVLKPNNNKLLNKITCLYFNLRFKKRPFSDKTMNCLINNDITSKEAIEYINTIKRLTKNGVLLENEIIYKFDSVKGR